jgi:hypothetical protein
MKLKKELSLFLYHLPPQSPPTPPPLIIITAEKSGGVAKKKEEVSKPLTVQRCSL